MKVKRKSAAARDYIPEQPVGIFKYMIIKEGKGYRIMGARTGLVGRRVFKSEAALRDHLDLMARDSTGIGYQQVKRRIAPEKRPDGILVKKVRK